MKISNLHWHNPGMKHLMGLDTEHFTTDKGIKLRRDINPTLRKLLPAASSRNIITHSYPFLEKDKPYIFVSTHSHDEDISSVPAVIDRHAYLLLGTTDQLLHNPKLYFGWINGFVYVDRFDKKSREDSLDKMERILKSGSSVIIFAEGGINNSENLLVNKIFNSPCILSQRTGFEVVPMASYHEYGSNETHFKVDNPLDLSKMDTKEGNRLLRDYLGINMMELMQNCSTPVSRADLADDCRKRFMIQRKEAYVGKKGKIKWSNSDVWDEELVVYTDPFNPTPAELRATFDGYDLRTREYKYKPVTITKENAYIFAPTLAERQDDLEHDFKEYMKKDYKNAPKHLSLTK